MFSRRWIAVIVAASGLISIAAIVPAISAEPGGDAPIRVGVCNPGKVFQQLDERKAIEDKMKDEQAKMKQELQRRKIEVDELKAQIDQLKPESTQYQEKNKQLMTKAVEFEVQSKLSQLELARLEKEQIRSLYEKIREACKEIALAKKLDLVLVERKPELPPSLEQLTPDQLRGALSQMDVLYMNEKADVTQEVILLINKKYLAGTSGGTAK